MDKEIVQLYEKLLEYDSKKRRDFVINNGSKVLENIIKDSLKF